MICTKETEKRKEEWVGFFVLLILPSSNSYPKNKKNSRLDVKESRKLLLKCFHYYLQATKPNWMLLIWLNRYSSLCSSSSCITIFPTPPASSLPERQLLSSRQILLSEKPLKCTQEPFASNTGFVNQIFPCRLRFLWQETWVQFSFNEAAISQAG